jgi:hypothetical protein
LAVGGGEERNMRSDQREREERSVRGVAVSGREDRSVRGASIDGREERNVGGNGGESVA